MIEEVKEELERYIAHFYSKDVLLPKEILVPAIVDSNVLSELLQVSVKEPIKGLKKKLVIYKSLTTRERICITEKSIQINKYRRLQANGNRNGEVL